MKNALFILAGATAFSLASCSQEKTADMTTSTVPADGAVMTSNMSDEAYHARGNRMADKYASDMKISDEPTKEKLRTAYYNRSKRYDTMHQKYASDTTGMASAMNQYNTETDAEFKGTLTDPSQYQAYQSSRPTYDESTNLDNNTAQSNGGRMSDTTGSMSGSNGNSGSNMSNGNASGNMNSGNASGNMNSGSASNTPATSGSAMRNQGMTNPDNTLSKSKTKLDNGAKMKMKGNDVKVRTADGQKMKM